MEKLENMEPNRRILQCTAKRISDSKRHAASCSRETAYFTAGLALDTTEKKDIKLRVFQKFLSKTALVENVEF